MKKKPIAILVYDSIDAIFGLFRKLKCIAKGAKLEGANKIGRKTIIDMSILGYGTYICNHSKLSNCKIGKYCSIADRVNVVQGTHPTSDWVSTHPAFFSTNNTFP